jgi:hypothetical protein
MPDEHRRQMFVSAGAAVMSTVYFALVAIMLQPIPSRSLGTLVLMPNAPVSSRTLVDETPIVAFPTSVERPARRRPTRPLPSFQLAQIGAAPAIVHQTISVAAMRERPRNPATRFFYGVLRVIQSGNPSADLP